MNNVKRMMFMDDIIFGMPVFEKYLPKVIFSLLDLLIIIESDIHGINSFELKKSSSF